MYGEEEYTMEINPNIVAEARRLLEEGRPLPAGLPSFQTLFVAEAYDSHIVTIWGIVHNEKSYKIGTRKDSQHA